MDHKQDAEFKLINEQDFKSNELSISLKNVTTKTEIRDGQKFFGGEAHRTNNDVSIRLMELGHQQVKLDTPAGTCASGHNLVLTFDLLDGPFKEGEVPMTFVSTAKVDSIEKADHGRTIATATLLQFDTDSWNRFCGLFSKRQNEIEEFFRAVKGH